MQQAALHPAATTGNALERLKALVTDDLEKVDAAILALAESHAELIPEISRYLVGSGGKRLRPMLTLACARLCAYEGDRHTRLAVCVEFIHTATLLHDDVVDESAMRRGRATANTVWGNQVSVLVGDYLLSQAFKLMVADGSLEVLRILSDASAVIAEGEVMQLSGSHDLRYSEVEYMRVISAKTARLFSAACEIGAVVAGRSAAEQEALRAYGEHLGIAFQITDDALDYMADKAALGKNPGDDFQEGKVTLPVILAYAAGNAGERAFWENGFPGKNGQEKVSFEQALALLQSSGALTRALEIAAEHAEKARKSLENAFPPSPLRAALLDILEFCVARAY